MTLAQVEEAVFQTERFRRLFIFGDLERNLFGLSEYRHLFRNEFDLTGCELRIDGFRCSGNDRSRESDDGFHAPFFEFLIEIHLRVDHNLSFAVMVAQVDEDHAAVIAHAVNPACEFGFLSDIGLSESAASMRSECMHFNSMLIMKIHNIPGNIAHISKKNWFFEKKLCFFIDKRYFRLAFPQTKRPRPPALSDVPVSLFL